MIDALQPPYFDSRKRVWILSRYADVLAAFQHPDLWPVGGGERRIETESRDEIGRLKLRGEVLAHFSPPHLSEWRPRLESEAARILRALPTACPLDLLRAFALPWGLTFAILATGADPGDRRKLAALSTRAFAATASADDPAVRAGAASATAELGTIFARIPLGEPMFVALSQTSARMLASCWHALASHPREYATLHSQPALMPAAVEELLRYAGIVRRVYRRARAPVEIGGAAIPVGELVALMLASANRDPSQFPDPGRVDFTRPAVSHFSLGFGRNFCPGVNPVRTAIAVATTVLISTFSGMELTAEPKWHAGAGSLFPAALEVTLTA